MQTDIILFWYLVKKKKKLFSFYKCASHALKLEGKTMQLSTHVKVAAEVV